MRVRHLRGVRYAHLADPADRTSPAVPVAGIAEEAPHIFPQVPGGLDPLIGPALGELPQSDNAFLLDAWVPEGASPDGAPSLPESAPSNAASPEAASPDAAPTLPVLVMVPGGAFISGAGTVRWYDGERLAREGMVVVVPNY
ncbi:MAG TPA: carboxylesterase family protein, partial [Actinomycetales bacterium]|nr:carboxylesterase family protein [Actinomycetales bacterium]